ncbi:NAD(P)H-dependent flavin oxidoreductase [Noviluteimonas gilva]|uniref:Nitronate monooxygenase n=1 Tax=Noviluteimonas gilva TaxID=2682097 RepID=A0A7C9LP81_9GAMM|nr:nitronate monooxygenase [Lysobacter gilvus]MUV14783.1 nitronate monooxygenase [Lysobacter gilvus]
MSPLLETLGLRVPIFQSPMAGVSSPAMAAAVSAAGGLGALGVGAMSATQAREAIAATRALDRGPLNVNVFAHRPARADAAKEHAWLTRLAPEFRRFNAQAPIALREIYTSFLVDDAMLAALIETRPEVMSFHFGLPTQAQRDALRAAGIVLIASATSLAEARAVEAAGLDAIVAQGYEAGGHRGVFDPDAHDDRLGAMALVRLLVRECKLPVIAAGGIMDGAGIRAALSLGACAAQLGTAFIDTDESLANAGYRKRLHSDAAHHTRMTRAISGRPARCLANAFTRFGADVPDDAIPDYPIAYDAGKALAKIADAAGEFGYGAQWAGQGAPLARTLSTRALMDALIAELSS